MRDLLRRSGYCLIVLCLVFMASGCEEYTDEELLKQALWETKLLAIEMELSYQGESVYRDTLEAEWERMQTGTWLDMMIPEPMLVEESTKEVEEATVWVKEDSVSFHYISFHPFGDAYKITGSSIHINSLREGTYQWRLYPLLQWNLGRPGDLYHVYLDRVVRVPD